MAKKNGNTPSALTQDRPNSDMPQFTTVMLGGEYFKYTAILCKFHRINQTEELLDTGDLVAVMVNMHLFRMLADYLAGEPHHELPHSSAIVEAHRVVLGKCEELEKYAHSVLVMLPECDNDELGTFLLLYMDCQRAVFGLCELFGDNMAEKFLDAVGGFKRSPHSFDRPTR